MSIFEGYNAILEMVAKTSEGFDIFWSLGVLLKDFGERSVFDLGQTIISLW